MNTPNPAQPIKELISVNEVGTRILEPCKHPKIAGLDADYCETCRTYYINNLERKKFYDRHEQPTIKTKKTKGGLTPCLEKNMFPA